MNLTEKGCFAELLKAELMERYGLREDQIAVELSFKTTDLDLARQILSDFDGASHNTEYFENERRNCDNVFGYGRKPIDFVSVHRKDGNYAPYLFGNDD